MFNKEEKKANSLTILPLDFSWLILRERKTAGTTELGGTRGGGWAAPSPLNNFLKNAPKRIGKDKNNKMENNRVRYFYTKQEAT